MIVEAGENWGGWMTNSVVGERQQRRWYLKHDNGEEMSHKLCCIRMSHAEYIRNAKFLKQEPA